MPLADDNHQKVGIVHDSCLEKEEKEKEKKTWKLKPCYLNISCEPSTELPNTVKRRSISAGDRNFTS